MLLTRGPTGIIAHTAVGARMTNMYLASGDKFRDDTLTGYVADRESPTEGSRSLASQLAALEAELEVNAPLDTTVSAYYAALEAACDGGDEEACELVEEQEIGGSISSYVAGLELLCDSGNAEACEILEEPSASTLTEYVRELELKAGDVPAPAAGGSLSSYVNGLSEGRGPVA